MGYMHVAIAVFWEYWAIMENQMEKNMENDMETGIIG